MDFTRAEDIDIVSEQQITLQHAKRKDGGEVVFVIRPLPIERVSILLDGWPYTENPDAQTPSDVLKTLAEWAPRAVAIAREGVVGPPLAFASGEDGVLWAAIALQDRSRIVNAILALSGVDTEATRAARTFPEQSSGVGDGPGTGSLGEEVA